MNNKLKYDSNAIQHLEGMEAIRKRPGMYIGSVGADGVLHITKEIISNAIDEYLAGFCSQIIIKIKDGVITVADNGRGIPVGKMQNGMNTLEAVFTLLHTGAKFNSDGSTGYNSSGGMNGVGAKATNALSEFFNVTVFRDKKKHTMQFRRGKKIDYIVEDVSTTETGTVVEFKPDPQIFTSTEIDMGALNKMLMEFSYLCKGLEIILLSNTMKRKYKSENGIYDYIQSLTKNNKITDIFYVNHTEGNIGVEVAMAYTDSYHEIIKLYTNNIPNTGGTHLTGFRTALTRKINEYAKENKILKDKDNNFTGDELREGLSLIINLKMPDPVFNGQTKDILTSAQGRTIIENLVSADIEHWFKSSPNSVKVIIDKALIARKAKEAAKKAKETIRKKSVGYTSILPTKLADCSSSKVDMCELYIVEGDSAGGSAKQARDRATQAILPLKGKIINTLKNDDKILNNAEIKSLVSAIGIGVGKHIDMSKLRYDKIVIMTDADVDGAHIRTLLLTFFYLHMTPLVEKGHVYIAMPPLYRVVRGKEIIYLQDDYELVQFKKKYGENIIVQRFKGLGEMSPQQLKETTMGENRKLKQVTIEDAEKACELLAILMGNDVASRREFIENNAHKAVIDL